VFELDADALLDLKLAHTTSYKPLPRYPSLTRDISLAYHLATPYGDIEAAAAGAAGDLLDQISLLSIYTGDRVEANHKSVALRLVLRSDERTLTDSEADEVLARVKSALTANAGAVAR
jgi:phenylalanyl-tRNA synthetase beta chain